MQLSLDSESTKHSFRLDPLPILTFSFVMKLDCLARLMNLPKHSLIRFLLLASGGLFIGCETSKHNANEHPKKYSAIKFTVAAATAEKQALSLAKITSPEIRDLGDLDLDNASLEEIYLAQKHKALRDSMTRVIMRAFPENETKPEILEYIKTRLQNAEQAASRHWSGK